MKDKLYKYRGLIISSFITILLIGIIFAVKGIYPFGKMNFGLIDFDHAYVPVYYKFWDILHGIGTSLFDFNLGAGLNSFGSLISNSLLSPTSWIIAFFPRNMVPQAMSFIVILKLLEINIIAYIVLDKLFKKVDCKFKIAFSILYTFSGWSFFNFSSMLYLDVVALFPLFVLAYYRLMKDGKWLMYIIVLTICLLFNYYMSWMILFFIIGATIISLLILDIKDKKKKAVLVTLLTLCSLGLSCFLFLPSFYQSITSTRMNQEHDSYYSIGVLFLKIIHLFPLFIPIFLTIKQFLVKKDKKVNIFFIILLVYLLIGVFVEGINLWWHTGSYHGFPFRYAYIPSFVLILIGMYYLNNNYKKITNKNVFNIIAVIILIVFLIVLSFIYSKEISSINYIYEVEKYSQFFGLLMLFVIGLGISFLIFRNNNKVVSILTISIIFVNTLIYGLYFIDCGEQTSSYTQNILNNFELKRDNYNYVDYTYELNFNFPYILKVPSMENRLHLIKQEEYDFYNNMGYNYFDTVMFGKGGTIFSNLLMQNKYILSKWELNERLYNLIDVRDDVYYYETKYNLNYIIPYNGTIYNEDTGDIFGNQNEIYKRLFSQEDNLINIMEDGEEYQLKKDNIYYMYVQCFNDYYCNDFDFFNDIHIEQQTSFDYSGYNNYIEFYVDEDMSIKLDREYASLVTLGYINIDQFIGFYNSISNYKVDIKTERNKRIFEYNSINDSDILIPINYDSAFEVLVNGKKVDYELNVYNMLSVPVKEGNNKIELVYKPKMFKEGIFISLGTLFLLVIITITNKKLKYLDKKVILYPLFILTCVLGFLFIIKIYIMSIK